MRIFIFFISLCPFIAFSQNGPTKIGDFEVGKTTRQDILNLDYYNWPYSDKSISMNLIKNDTEFEMYLKNPADSFFINTEIYEVRPEYIDRMYTNETLLMTTDSNFTYFIPQLKIGEVDPVTINNISLFFYHDTLSKITYYLPTSAAKILIEKYKGQGFGKKEEISKSLCKRKYKNGVTPVNKKISYGLVDSETKTISQIAFISKLDEYCEWNIYYKVEIYANGISDRWMNSILPYLKRMKDQVKAIKESDKESIKSKF